MPELPEVETVRAVLATKLQNKTIKNVEVYWDKIIQYPSLNEFKHNIQNQKFIDFKRHGKYLIFELEDYFLVSHLRMEGKYYVRFPQEKEKHTHVIFTLDSGEEFVYNDVRKFGTMHLYKKDEKITSMQKVGKDALLIELDELWDKTRNKTINAKTMLLDQHILAGVGNIYSDEILFASKIHPEQKIATLSKQQFSDILINTKKILKGAIKAGGTTIRSYTSSLGIDGRFQLKLKVHTKKQCPICNSDIIKIKVSGRGTYLCPNCQKIK